jgi:hypothetical protein
MRLNAAERDERCDGGVLRLRTVKISMLLPPKVRPKSDIATDVSGNH